MARKNPLGKIKDAAAETLKDPIGTGQKVVGQAVGQAMVAAGAVTSRVGRRKASAPSASPRPVATPSSSARKVQGDPVVARPTPVEEPAVTPAKKAPATKAAAKKAAVKKAAVKKPPTKKAPTKAAAAQAPAKKTAAKKTAAKKTAAKKTAAKKTAAKKTPLSAAELAAGAGTEVITPVGTRGADVATNPDTTDHDLQQVGTEPLMDPALTKAVASEAATLRRGADPDKR